MTKWLVLSLALAPLSACSTDASGPKDAEDTSLRTEAAFCTTWAKAACNDDVVEACNNETKDDCVKNQSAFCETIIPFGYSSKHAQECIDAVRDAYADAELDRDELDTVLNLGGDCASLVNGGRSEGDACTDSTNCDTVRGYSCVIKGDGQTGTCQIPSVKSAGERCADAGTVCEEGDYCDGSHCVEFEALGADCTNDVMCGDENLCEIPDGEDTGTCQPKAPLRASCESDEDCASGICLTSLAKPICVDNIKLTIESTQCLNL